MGFIRKVKDLFSGKEKRMPEPVLGGPRSEPRGDKTPGGEFIREKKKSRFDHRRKNRGRRDRGASGAGGAPEGTASGRRAPGVRKADSSAGSQARTVSPGSGEDRSRGRSSRKKQGKREGGRRRHLGGSAQQVDFPELLQIDTSSEEFRGNGFRSLGLSDRVVLVLAANRFRTPTDIQQAFIPVALSGADVLGQAKTGTGKTIAFLMPIMERLDRSSQVVQALVVVPTRELCRQVSWEACRFGRSLEATVLSLYGGTSVSREAESLQKGAQIVVGTPGRLLDHIYNSRLDLAQLKTLVLDEADRMFDIGFRQDIIKIIKSCQPQRQVFLLSATLGGEVEELSRHYMRDPVPLYVSKDEITVESIWQRYVTVERHQKMDLLVNLLQTQKPTQSLIFTNTKKMSDSVAMQLAKRGFKARCIHSDLNQNKRERIMDAFRTGKIEHLVATDVAVWGLDITGISHVINYDVPENPEDYVHRVGRTGRMGAAGKAFTFVTVREGKELTAVEKFMDKILEEWDGS